MAKRFTDTGKWGKKWFRALPPEYKLLWLYVLDECDYAGVWDVDMDAAGFKIGAVVDADVAFGLFGQRVLILESGVKWWVTGFIDFQYGGLHVKSKTYTSVLSILKKNNIVDSSGVFIRGFEGALKGHPSPIDAPPKGDNTNTKYNKGNNTGIKVNTHIDTKESTDAPSKGHRRGIEGASKGHVSPIDGASDTVEVNDNGRGADNRGIIWPCDDVDFKEKWGVWLEYKWAQFRWKDSMIQEQHALEGLWTMSGCNKVVAIEYINASIAKGAKNIFKPDNNFKNGNTGNAGAARNIRPTGAGILQPGDSFLPQ